MTKALRVTDYVHHILAAIERIERHVAGADAQAFLNSELLQDAVIRNLELIGEAASNVQRVDAAFALAHSEIPWRVMYTMRNRLTHGYDTVDLDMVWNTVRGDLPPLYKLLKALPIKPPV